jgi:hypothetical protein
MRPPAENADFSEPDSFQCVSSAVQAFPAAKIPATIAGIVVIHPQPTMLSMDWPKITGE